MSRFIEYLEHIEYSVNDDIHNDCLIHTNSNVNGYYQSKVLT